MLHCYNNDGSKCIVDFNCFFLRILNTSSNDFTYDVYVHDMIGAQGCGYISS